jgi:hypothetical protein
MRLIEFEVEGEGETVLVEVDGSYESDEAPLAGVLERADETLDAAIRRIRPAAVAISRELRSLAPEELHVEFGVKLDGKAGGIIVRAGAEAHCRVVLKWVGS